MSISRTSSATWRSEGREPLIEWIDMPAELRDRYQSYTRADLRKLRGAGYARRFVSPTEGIELYAGNVASAVSC